MSPRIAAALVPTLALGLGCGGGADSADAGLSFAATPTQTVQSQSGALTSAVHAQAGHTPARCINAFRFVITDSTGAPVEHLQVTVSPFMPFMGHGSSVTPAVAAEGGGSYVVTNVVFPMAGHWDLNTNFTGPVTDAAKPSFDIP